MITTATTFVIGAGASVPYGLPAGPQLCSRARELNPQSDIYQWILQDGSIEPGHLNDFLEDLRNHPAPSIDGYLETRQTDITTQKIGKHVIAALMGDAIRTVSLPANTAEQDWLGYVFARMLEGANDVATFARENQIVFVTFNFDRIIESYFLRSLGNAYRDNTGIAVPPVIHVHGKLPMLPSNPLRGGLYGAFPSDWVDWLKEAASSINVVLDEIDPRTLDTAREVIEKSQKICFLGFAYATPNLKRLGLPDKLGPDAANNGNVFGSAYRLWDGEQATVVSRLKGKIKLGNPQQDCCAVLRYFPVFE